MTPTTNSTEASLEARLARFPSAGRAPVFDEADVSYAVTDTAIGRILLARTDVGALVASTFVPDDASEAAVLARLSRTLSPRVLRRPAPLDDARRQLDDYLAGRRRSFDLQTDLALATPFQRSVLEALAASVPYGTRSTYRSVAESIHRPSAARAVGTALGSNPLCVVLPCHRVVGSSGRLTGYAGGIPAKEFLLELEAHH